MIEKVTYEGSVNSLLEASIDLIYKSKKSNDHDDMQLFARSSAIYTILLLETIANICVEHLDFERSVFKEVDRLPIVAKFDFYLRLKIGKMGLPKGDSDVQSIQEIKNLRDGIVHPKVQKVVWNVHDQKTEHMSSEAKLTEHLKIPKDSVFWEFEDAKKIAVIVHSFLNRFFLEHCGYSPKQSCALLFSEEKVPSFDDELGPTCVLLSTRKELESWGLKLDYLCGDYKIY